MQRFRIERPPASMTIAFVALLVALSGTAVALPGKSTVDSGDIKNGQVKRADIASGAVTSGEVKNRSLRAEDFKAGDLPTGPKGEKGDKGDKGATGPAGPFPSGNLPRGATLRGHFAATGQAAYAGQRAEGAASFGFTFASAPTPHVLAPDAEPTAQCPGSFGNPQAAPGHLCVYESVTLRADDDCVYTGDSLCDNATRHGGIFFIAATEPGEFYARGAWAATAP